MSTTDESPSEILLRLPIYLHQYVASIFYIIGNVGNLLSLMIFFKKSWRKNVCVFYFIICLFINTIFINFSLLGAILINGFDMNILSSSVLLCKLFYYIFHLSSSYFPIVLILASIDRLLITSQNTDTRLYSSKRLAYFTLSISGFVWIVYCLHVLIKVNIQEFSSTSTSSCYFDLSPIYLNFMIYSSLMFSIVLPMIMIVLSILAWKNVRQIRALPRQKRSGIRTMNKKDFQLLRCLYVHNIVYIICSIMMMVGFIYGAKVALQNQSPTEQAMSNFLYSVGAVLHYIPYCSSCIICASLSKVFRQELKRMTYRICGNNIAPIRDEDNQQRDQIRDTIIVSTILASH